jgi:hypothetical protein
VLAIERRLTFKLVVVAAAPDLEVYAAERAESETKFRGVRSERSPGTTGEGKRGP